MSDIPELTEREFGRAIKRSQRERIMRGQIESGEHEPERSDVRPQGRPQSEHHQEQWLIDGGFESVLGENGVFEKKYSK